jgi:hypothetical protein
MNQPNTYRRSARTALAMLGFCWWVLPAGAQEGLGDVVYTVGTTVTDAHGTNWAYVLWQATTPALLGGQAFSVNLKAGDANSTNLYTRRSVVQLQTDPSIIQGLLARAGAIGQDPYRLADDLNNLFATLLVTNKLVPTNGLNTTAGRLSAVIRGSLAGAEHYQNLLLLSKNHPAVSLALGCAAVEMIGPGKTTFEIRAYDPARNQDLAVVGRLTVEAGLPTILPAPGQPVLVPDYSARGHLNLRFRWGTPDGLRRLSLLQFGYDLYRVQKAYAESQGWGLAPPPLAVLLSVVTTNPAAAKRINRLPILPSRRFTLEEASTFWPPGDTNTFFVADDDGRFRTGYFNRGFTNGAQFYYYAAARDVLGRDGLLSGGALATVCDHQPPYPPMRLRAWSDVVSNRPALRISWDQVTNYYTQTSTDPQTGATFEMRSGVVTNYWVYRWHNPDEMFQFYSDPSNHLVAVIPHVPGKTTLAFLDNGGGAPSPPADYGKTVWYTVRAGDNGACGPNLSPHSAPAYAVLRDRVGPVVPPDALVEINCPRPFARFLQAQQQSGSPDSNSFMFRLTCTRTSPSVEWAEFYVHNDLSVRLARVPFAGRGATVDTWFTGQRGAVYIFECVVGWAQCNKRSTNATSGVVAGPSTPVYHMDVNFAGNATRHLQDARDTSGCCGHVAEDPVTGELVFPKVTIPPTPTSKEWRLYQRVDNGPMTLMAQGVYANALDPAQYEDDVLPAQGGTVCYYLQVLDEQGNASPLQVLTCFLKLPKAGHSLPKPVLAPIQAAGNDDNPRMNLTWFCPPPGVDRFEVSVAALPTPPPTNGTDFSSYLCFSNVAPELLTITNSRGEVLSNLTFSTFRTPRVGGDFSGVAGQFLVPATVEQGKTYAIYVKALSQSGKSGSPSDIETFCWMPGNTPMPQVPWPMRPLASTNANFLGAAAFLDPANNTLNYFTDAKGAAVWIGYTETILGLPTVNGSGHTVFARCAEDVNAWALTNLISQRLLPVTLYRVQVPNSAFPNVSSNVVQVSPLLEQIAFGRLVSSSTNVLMLDPFVATVWWQDASNKPHLSLMLRDTSPQIKKARYKYILVRFKPNGEIDQLIPTNEVEVP